MRSAIRASTTKKLSSRSTFRRRRPFTTISSFCSTTRRWRLKAARVPPGPLAGNISYFAPVSLLFFFFLMFLITVMRGIDLHPMNYFFLSCAFFAFHLLLVYLVDHISIHAAFATASAVSVFLVVSYLRLVAGMRFAAVEAGSAQMIYLVLFSYVFFFKGFTGLAVTIGSILTLFVVMQMTGRIKWTEKFAQSSAG